MIERTETYTLNSVLPILRPSLLLLLLATLIPLQMASAAGTPRVAIIQAVAALRDATSITALTDAAVLSNVATRFAALDASAELSRRQATTPPLGAFSQRRISHH